MGQVIRAVLVPMLWLAALAASVALIAVFVAPLFYSASPLPQHAVASIAAANPIVGVGDPVETAATIQGDVDLDLTELLIEIVGPAPATDRVRVLSPLGLPRRIAAIQRLHVDATWDQRDERGQAVPPGKYELRLRIFFTSAAGSGAAFAHTAVELRLP